MSLYATVMIQMARLKPLYFFLPEKCVYETFGVSLVICRDALVCAPTRHAAQAKEAAERKKARAEKAKAEEKEREAAKAARAAAEQKAKDEVGARPCPMRNFWSTSLHLFIYSIEDTGANKIMHAFLRCKQNDSCIAVLQTN